MAVDGSPAPCGDGALTNRDAPLDIAPDQPPDPDQPASRRRGLSPIHLDGGDALRHPAAIPRSKRRRLVFGWYGGKSRHLDRLLPGAHHDCEPFAGRSRRRPARARAWWRCPATAIR